MDVPTNPPPVTPGLGPQLAAKLCFHEIKLMGEGEGNTVTNTRKVLKHIVLKESVQCRDRQTFSVKGQITNILSFGAIESLLQPLNSAVTV